MEWFHKIVESRLPNHDFLMAYGSGVFTQANCKGVPMVDYVLGVPNLLAFHQENLQKNPGDYSDFSRWLGPENLSKIARESVFYNVVNVWGRPIKYGVVNTSVLIEDLKDWKHHFLAGRCKNPIKRIKSNKTIDEAFQLNLEQGVDLALLASPEKINLVDFYKTISGFSYKGSLREVFRCEDKNKIDNILKENIFYFDEVYGPILKHDPQVLVLNGVIHQDKSQCTNDERLSNIPALGTNLQEYLSELEKRVFLSSLRQISLGLVSAGANNSFSYFLNKVKKSIKSKKAC